MAAFVLAWDWNIPSNIEHQSSPMQVVSPEPQIPNMQAGKTASNEIDRLAASLQNEEDVVLQKQKENKAKKSSKSLINYQTIQAILKIELQVEADKDIQIAVY